MISLGQLAFEAYAEKVGQVTYDNKKIPSWNNLTEEVRQGWEAAGEAVAESVAEFNL